MPENNKKLLVAEDDKFLATAYKTKLEKEGYNVRIAYDGNETLQMMDEELPDLLILDLVMPVKDGFSVMEEMNANPKFKDVPVVITSNLSQEADIERGMKLGARDYIVKTELKLNDLLNRISEWTAKA